MILNESLRSFLVLNWLLHNAGAQGISTLDGLLIFKETGRVLIPLQPIVKPPAKTTI
jgi:hypothetical protein